MEGREIDRTGDTSETVMAADPSSSQKITSGIF